MTGERTATQAQVQLDTPEDIAEYINAAMETGNERAMLAALSEAAHAVIGESGLAECTGLSREALHHALSEKANPPLSTFLAIVEGLGLELAVRAQR